MGGATLTPAATLTGGGGAAPARKPFLFRVDPRYLQAGLATTILVVGQLLFRTIGGFDRLVLSVACALGADFVLSLWLRGKWPNVASSYISGLSIVILTKPSAILWPFALGSLISIASKYVLTYKNRHLFNPTNFGLCVMLLVAHSQVGLLSTQWGNSLVALSIIWAWGFFVVYRARVLHVSVTYLISFLVLSYVRSLITGNTFYSEMAPMSGPMQTLFMFFMVTDPATVVSRWGARIGVTILVALVEFVFRMQHQWHIPGLDFVLWAPSMFALFFVGPVARFIDLAWFNGASFARPTGVKVT
jgi:Na+-translocating ferredoxin:NAD+ oxidoreductase RnfD subunit